MKVFDLSLLFAIFVIYQFAMEDRTKYTFSESFGYGPKNVRHIASFTLDLSSDEVETLRAFLRENGDCDYAYLEKDHPDLFERINDAANEAVLLEINRHRRKKLDFGDVDWGNLCFDFYWPQELIQE